MKKLFKGTVIILALTTLTGCVEEYRTTVVKGEVVEKEHDEESSYYKSYTDSEGNKKRKLVEEEEEFEVNIRYEDIEKEFEFEDDDFFERVQVGEKIDIHLITGYDKEGKAITRDIELIED